MGGGQALVDGLAAQAERLGVAFRYETTALRLEQDEDGRVVALLARDHAGRTRFAGRVVLACGGFEGNGEMMTRYVGPRAVFLRPICKGGYFNRGEGIRMALDIGAAGAGEFGSFHAEPIDPRSGVSEPSVFIFPYGILVNKEGRRFTDEAPGTVDAHYERVTRRIFEQRDGIAWVVLDARHTRIPNYRLGIRTDKPPVAAASLPELAAALGLPADALQATVAEYNAACVPGEFRPLELDGLATRGLAPPKSNWAVPLDEPPFHAYPIMSANVFTFGGLQVDAGARVLDRDGLPIPGLYAAGEIIGLYYGTYTGATSVLKGMVFGRIAGQDAAQPAQRLMRLRGRVALVTGAAGGIGGAVARRFAQEGAALCLADRAGTDAVAAAVAELGGRSIQAGLDVTRRAEMDAAVAATLAAFGRLDILVNVAGVVSLGPAATLAEAEWDRVLDVNLKGTFLACQAVIPAMRRQRYGRIVNLGSVIGKNGGNPRPWIDPAEQTQASNAAYGASKAGVHALTFFLARELAADGITVNAVAPGPIASAMTADFPASLRALIPVGRMGRAEDVAAAVLFLAGEESGFVTGEVLDVNGGMWAD